MSADRFLVFVRSGKEPWHAIAATPDLARAIHEANVCVETPREELREDRAVVMEIGGTDAMPMFTWKYRAKL